MENHHYYGNTSIISRSNNNSNNSNIDLVTTTVIADGTSLNFSNLDSFSGANIGEIPHRGSMDDILEELLQDAQAYTDTNNTCSHTTNNNYFHLQSEIPSPNEAKSSEDNDSYALIGGPKRRKKRERGEPRGDNKEAVRKYRKKLKARETFLQDEINKLKASNQQLLKRLENEAALQAEALRLKCLLADIRGRLEGETASFRYNRPSEMSHCNGNCGVGGTNNGTSESRVYGQQPLNGSDATVFLGSGPKHASIPTLDGIYDQDHNL